jgi:hypothetical protein
MKRHPADLVSLGFGLVFLVIAAAWAARGRYDVSWPAVGWVAAGTLIGAGLLGLLATLRRRPDQDTPPR